MPRLRYIKRSIEGNYEEECPINMDDKEQKPREEHPKIIIQT